jgi:putative membrane protein
MSTRSSYFVASMLIAMFVFMSAVRAADDRTKLSDEDLRFIMAAAKGGKMEVDMGKLAKDKASNQDVKNFGQRMVDDHTKANKELHKLAKQKDVKIETKDKDNKGVTDDEMKMMEHLKSLNGADFDKEYMKQMVEDHEKDVKEFQEASQNAADADVKKWATDTLPTLQDHLKSAKEIQGKVGAS